ncbi:hypothetical protein VIGAN_09129500 [Vigna angularis var. angularis]|uniref:Uncharacterized protein n=1 Tax=Vigna angularis var. angularis TaxID=157739 RepID=A0A0S3SY17_PHAAN|nr:hypothetical protein VIGAN_09129500 [Vigna angularis var. angularis]
MMRRLVRTMRLFDKVTAMRNPNGAESAISDESWIVDKIIGLAVSVVLGWIKSLIVCDKVLSCDWKFLCTNDTDKIESGSVCVHWM